MKLTFKRNMVLTKQSLSLLDQISSLKKTAARLQDTSNALSLTGLLSKFGIEVQEEPVTVQARRLQAPTLQFGDGGTERDTHSGSWNLNRKRFSV
jgi:hypothetical protein